VSDSLADYYQSHWAQVEADRMARYEAMFQWRDSHEVLIAPAQIEPGQRVADYGCGPGALSVELARRVGDTGQVLALDINSDFLERTRNFAEQAGLSARVETQQVANDRIQSPDTSVDRVICKNVLEYVPDPELTIAEFHRILKPGGIAHIIDSDWGAALLEPLGEQFIRIMSAANIAFKTPLIGRNLYGICRKLGFQDIRVQVLANPDTAGGMRPVLHNMVSYARTAGTLEETELTTFLEQVDQAVADRTYLAILPQFLVTARR